MYSKEELDNIEGWRGFLAIVVFIGHLSQILWYPKFGDNGLFSVIMGTMANLSVVYFFVISGMLIFFSALNLTNDKNFFWDKYIINRISRIYPSLCFALLLCFLLTILFPYLNHHSEYIKKIISDKSLVREKYFITLGDIKNSLYMRDSNILQINGPLWSLSIEWWLYVAAMFLFLVFNVSSNLGKIIFGTLALYALRNAKIFQFEWIYYSVIWFIGGTYTLFPKNRKSLLNKFLAVALFCLILLVIVKGIGSLNILKAKPEVYGVTQLVLAFIFLKIVFKIKIGKIFRRIGLFSYTLYIIHFPIILFIFAISREFVGDNSILLLIETILLFFAVPVFAYLVSFFAENKIFRSYMYKLNENSFLKVN